MDAILEFFSNAFSNLSWLAVLLVAMLPIAEAKVAIPFGLSQEIWGSGALSTLAAGTLGFVGSMLPAFFVIPFLKPIFNALKQTKMFRKVVIFLENIFVKKAQKQEHRIEVQLRKHKVVKNELVNDDEFLKTSSVSISTSGQQSVALLKTVSKKTKITDMLTLLFFVAIPLPLAGVWTSSAIAAFGQMKFWPSFLAIAVGNLFEVIFVTILCVLFIDSIGIVLIVTVVLIALYAGLMIVFNKKNNNKSKCIH